MMSTYICYKLPCYKWLLGYIVLFASLFFSDDYKEVQGYGVDPTIIEDLLDTYNVFGDEVEGAEFREEDAKLINDLNEQFLIVKPQPITKEFYFKPENLDSWANPEDLEGQLLNFVLK